MPVAAVPAAAPAQEEWSIPNQARLRYRQQFNQLDRAKRGFLLGLEAKSVLTQSGLPNQLLAQIWWVVDLNFVQLSLVFPIPRFIYNEIPPLYFFPIKYFYHNSKRSTNTADRNFRWTFVHRLSSWRLFLVSKDYICFLRNLSDIDKDGKLTCDEFCLALHLAEMVRLGHPLPAQLPRGLIPPSYRSPNTAAVAAATTTPGTTRRLSTTSSGTNDDNAEDAKAGELNLKLVLRVWVWILWFDSWTSNRTEDVGR